MKLNKKVVTDNAKAVTPETKPAAKAKTEPKEKVASKYVSVSLINGARMRVAEYQDYTFTINDQPKRRLTDTELAADWQREFPNAVAFTAFHVAGARRDFNKGIHSKAYPGHHDSRAWFVDAKGAKTQTAPKAETPAAAKTAAAKPDAAPKADAHPKSKVARKKTAA